MGLQTNRHIGRDTENIFLSRQVPGMDDIAFSDPAFILLPEAQQGLNRIVGAGFYFDGVHLILGFAVIGDDEVNFDIISLLFLVVAGVKNSR